MDSETSPEKNADGDKLRKRGNAMLQRILASEKREKKWRDHAEAAERAYSADDSDTSKGKLYDFNILHSNVETIVPAIYNSTPVPDIRPRRVEATGPEPMPPQLPPPEQIPPEAVMQAKKAMAQYEQAAQVYAQKKAADDTAKNYGRMVERAISIQIDDNRLDGEIEASTQDAFTAGRGVVRLRFEADTDEQGAASNERITFEAVSWRDYREGPATRWDNVPWVAFKTVLSRETFDRFADKGLLDKQKDENNAPPSIETGEDDEIVTWEYWDKLERKVCFVRESDGHILKEEQDPLGLPGFFPVPCPVQPITVTGKRVPVNPFRVYKRLADELDRVTRRIDKIVEGLKVRGLVAGSGTSLSKLADADDNTIIVEDNLEQLVQTGGLEKAIAWWPLEPAIAVLAQLYQQREQTKAAIYEITGISDIVRGASNAGETATAQQIKTQWGSLRIQKMQRLIERQVRDIFVMMAHLISTRISPETLSRMTGIEITPEIGKLMQSPLDANYRVNVESNSTIRADLTQQKQEMAEFMAGTAQYFSSVGAIVQTQPQAAEPLAEIFAASARMFRLGKQAEDALDQFVAIAKQVAKQPPMQEEQGPPQETESDKARVKLEEDRGTFEQQKAADDANVRDQEFEMKRQEADRAHDERMHQRKMAEEESKRTEARELREHEFRMAEAGLKRGEDGSLKSKGDESAAAMMNALAMLADTLAKSNQALMAGLEQVAKVVSAPRKTELVMGKDGKKTAISAPMVN